MRESWAVQADAIAAKWVPGASEHPLGRCQGEHKLPATLPVLGVHQAVNFHDLAVVLRHVELARLGKGVNFKNLRAALGRCLTVLAVIFCFQRP